MDTARLPRCQPGAGRARTRLGVLAGWVLLATVASAVSPPPEPGTGPAVPPVPAAPVPREWQRELGTLAWLQASVVIVPDQPAAGGKTPLQRLAEAYQALGSKYPSQAEVQKACGDFFSATGDKPQAFGYWLRAQSLNPADARLAQSLGEAYLQSGNTRNAAAQFQIAVDNQPDQAQFHTDLANVLYLFRHELIDPPALPDAEAVLAKALEQFRLSAQLSPASRELAQAYAETFYVLAKPDWAQALKAWQQVLGLSGEDTDFANLQLARVNLRLQQPREAEVYLDRLHRPEFAPLQAKLREQARKMEPTR